MHKIVRPLLAVVLGFVVGSCVNMGLIELGGRLIPPPAGADVATMDGLKAAMPLFSPQHFVFPFLAHAVGTFAGAFVACLVAPAQSHIVAYVVGAIFLLGGIASVLMLPSPAWFTALDLVLAYLPAAWTGKALASLRNTPGEVTS
jgi:hypothetical protein